MIDRESVIRQLTQHIARAENIENDWMDCVSIPMLRGALELLKKQDNCENCAIAIEDRQPVVRCKDCKHNQAHGCNVLCDLFYGSHYPHGFCDQGEHRDGV